MRSGPGRPATHFHLKPVLSGRRLLNPMLKKNVIIFSNVYDVHKHHRKHMPHGRKCLVKFNVTSLKCVFCRSIYSILWTCQSQLQESTHEIFCRHTMKFFMETNYCVNTDAWNLKGWFCILASHEGFTWSHHLSFWHECHFHSTSWIRILYISIHI